MSDVTDYLGDGVYATWDGYGVMLDLRAQAPTLPITQIYLETVVLEALNDFVDRHKTDPAPEAVGG